MEFKQLVMSNLSEVNHLYQDVVKDLDNNGLSIWDHTYPFERFEKDINQKTMVGLFSQSKIVACANLTFSNSISDLIDWDFPFEKSLYIDRFAVSVDHRGNKIGYHFLKHIESFALKNNCCSIRLSVVDFNTPAINFYEAYGFKRVEGKRSSFIDSNSSYKELAFELNIK
ncbi:N-acetyltransferase [Erysipelothrix urinaevulpis]|uniref:GNAT family N-acetyltransferase n=1 Tax=Erysipelothrix urinaevulpis TaxID=2683717 RepID=UPI001359494E|nr:GNAT family N-acetyltransferase [Erysipelothrix urinaevulpis]